MVPSTAVCNRASWHLLATQCLMPSLPCPLAHCKHTYAHWNAHHVSEAVHVVNQGNQPYSVPSSNTCQSA